jgi:hypothetical protein
MIGQLLAFLLGTFLVAIGIVWAIGPVRVLAGLVAVPLMWAIVTAVALGAWVALRWHGATP